MSYTKASEAPNTGTYINNYNDYLPETSRQVNEVRKDVRSVPRKEETFEDIMDDLSKIPKSKLQNKEKIKYKNGYKQGVEISVLSMESAIEKNKVTR